MRPSDRRAERAMLATAAGVHALETRAAHALSGALATLGDAARDGKGVRTRMGGLVHARDLFRQARTAERALTPHQRAALRELRRDDDPPRSGPGLPE